MKTEFLGGVLVARDKVRPQCVISQIYIILVLTVFLFYTGEGGYGSIAQTKFYAFTCLAGIYIAALILTGVESWLIRGKLEISLKNLLRRVSWPQRAALLYMAATWVSAVCSPYWPETVIGVSRYEGAATISLYCVSFCLVSAYAQIGRATLWVCAFSVTAQCVLCTLQLAGFNPFGLYPAGYGYYDAGKAYPGAYLGTIGNVDLAAAFFSLAVPILLYSMVRLRERTRFLLLIPLVLSAYIVVRMNVMAGYLGVAGGIALALPAGWRERRTRIIAGAVLFALLAIGTTVVYAADMPMEMLHQAHAILHGQADPSFGSGRIHIWTQVCQAIARRPLLGFGPDTMLHGGLEPFTRYSEELGRVIVSPIDIAHNEYLNILYHQGIFALGAYLWLLVLLAKRWVSAAPTDGSLWALGAGIIGYCIQAMFGFSICVTAPFFWIALGLLDGASRTKNREEKQK